MEKAAAEALAKSHAQAAGNKYMNANKSTVGKIQVGTPTTTEKTYKEGGLAKKTGPAWLDGTFNEPERILTAHQTRAFDKLVDFVTESKIDEYKTVIEKFQTVSANMMYTSVPGAMAIDRSSYYNGGNSSSIGDIYVTINEAKLQDDADYEAVAERVGEVFARNLSQQGFHTARFSF